MRISSVKSNKNTTYYVIRDIKKDGKRSTETVENLGTGEEIMIKYNCKDALAWAREYAKKLTGEEKNSTRKVLVPFLKDTIIDKNTINGVGVGYLFLQQIYHELKIPSICKKAAKSHSFTYNLDSILSRLIYGRILSPSSKLSCHEYSKSFYEQPDFDVHHIYRALSVLSLESDDIQASLYNNSKNIIDRKSGILYYDCTNYFFETEFEEGLKKYGVSKEHRPSPIVQMGLFIDGSGIPLAFCINDGNKNEQLSLKPLEQQIMKDFELSKFVVCTDAGLSSAANRKFNNYGERSFITTQSIKGLTKELKDWCLDKDGWQMEGSSEIFNLDDIEDMPESRNVTYYKQKYITGYDEEREIEFNQTLIITFSPKYKSYQSAIRNGQVERALKAIKTPSKLNKSGQNDYKRFIKKLDEKGKDAALRYVLNQEVIEKESIYDGFYAVATNLDDDPAFITKINKGRWKIEESFRIMKSEFKARPVYLKRDDRIKAHFLTCFIALLVYRLMEKKLDDKYTCDEIIKTLRDMELTRVSDQGYTPHYKRTDITDALHEMAGFRTDYQLTTEKSMKGICRRSKGL